MKQCLSHTSLIANRVVFEAGTSENKTETETWVAETKTETEAIKIRPVFKTL